MYFFSSYASFPPHPSSWPINSTEDESNSQRSSLIGVWCEFLIAVCWVLSIQWLYKDPSGIILIAPLHPTYYSPNERIHTSLDSIFPTLLTVHQPLLCFTPFSPLLHGSQDQAKKSSLFAPPLLSALIGHHLLCAPLDPCVSFNHGVDQDTVLFH